MKNKIIIKIHLGDIFYWQWRKFLNKIGYYKYNEVKEIGGISFRRKEKISTFILFHLVEIIYKRKPQIFSTGTGKIVSSLEELNKIRNRQLSVDPKCINYSDREINKNTFRSHFKVRRITKKEKSEDSYYFLNSYYNGNKPVKRFMNNGK